LNGEHTWNEIVSQPEVWRAAIAAGAQSAPRLQPILQHPGEALAIGCGSTHYLSLAAAPLANRFLPGRWHALPSSELYLFPRHHLPRKEGALVAFSRSGETTETVLAVRAFQQSLRGPTLTVGNYPESTLARECDVALIIPQGQEKSIAQTRSFTSMLLAFEAALAATTGDAEFMASLERLPSLAQALLDKASDLASSLGRDMSLDTLIFLGSGPFYGIACEAMLKMKEMSLSHSEAYHYMEFRHGPKSIVSEGTLICALLSDTAAAEELRLLGEMRSLGATILLVCPEPPAQNPAQLTLATGSGVCEEARLALSLLPLQVLAYQRAIAKGLDPDCPTHLDAVVRL